MSNFDFNKGDFVSQAAHGADSNVFNLPFLPNMQKNLVRASYNTAENVMNYCFNTQTVLSSKWAVAVFSIYSQYHNILICQG